MPAGPPEKELERSPTGELYLGSLIRSRRREKGWSIPQLAERVGYHPDSLSKIEGNAALFSSEKLVLFANVLGIDMAELKKAPLHPQLATTHRKAAAQQKPIAASLDHLVQVQSELVALTKHLERLIILIEAKEARREHQFEELKREIELLRAQQEVVRTKASLVTASVSHSADPFGSGNDGDLGVVVTEWLNRRTIDGPIERGADSAVVRADELRSFVEELEGAVEDVARANDPHGAIRTLLDGAIQVYGYLHIAFSQATATVDKVPGNRGLVMSGVSETTCPMWVHEERAQFFRDRGYGVWLQIQNLLEVRRSRFYALREMIQHSIYRDICPRSAIHNLAVNGIYTPEDGFLLRGGIPENPDQRRAHFKELLELLEEPNYYLGLVDSSNDRSYEGYWLVKQDYAALLQVWPSKNEIKDVRTVVDIRENKLVSEMYRAFDHKWYALPEQSREKKDVISYIESELKLIP